MTRASNNSAQLKRYLGQTGKELFALLVNLAPVSNQKLLDWTLALDGWLRKKIGGKKKPIRALNKALVGQWRQCIRPLDKNSHQPGFEFHVSHQEVWGRSEGEPWHGVVFLVYEYHTNHLFHHVVDIGSGRKIPAELLLFVVTKAYAEIKKTRSLPDSLPQPRLYVPKISDVPVIHEGMQDVYTQTIALLESSKTVTTTSSSILVYFGYVKQDNQPGKSDGRWRGQQPMSDFNDWLISRCTKPISPSRRVRAKNSNELRRQLAKMATYFSKLMKRNSQGTQKSFPRWIALNTARATKHDSV